MLMYYLIPLPVFGGSHINGEQQVQAGKAHEMSGTPVHPCRDGGHRHEDLRRLFAFCAVNDLVP